ncbi:MAG: hypothetical protein KME15_26505 [Drouetiella hepatica Uher 2000/2452]|jgi:hypothetical protein|uniref:Uncharacterized protein n=1 Tax=Drouetiella hepatica Uher 2000/2452 TaxID=904376 RepID=A0A951QI71_9CYAN|nr:hypothetical protein [Drouetiella hepatica Uher 2000/2452]
MERFLGALSITLLLSGWAAITQFQSPYQSPQNSVVQFAQAEAIPDRSQLIDILARVLKVNQSQAVHFSRDRFHHAQASRQVSVVSSQNMSPFGKIYGDIQTTLLGTFTP